MRINKYLASTGLASRRNAEKFILDGRVKVNNVICTNLATDIKQNDVVKFDNKVIKPTEKFVYFMLNKPKGYVSTASDDKGRRTVLELIDTTDRIYPVGRLDYDSEGLLLLTNDGELTYKLTHPKNQIPKTYYVVINSNISQKDIDKLEKGVVIDGRKLSGAKITIISERPDKTELNVIIHEGRNREIRKMFEVIGKFVTFLKRTKIANLSLGKLQRGTYRQLSQKEVKYLKSL